MAYALNLKPKGYDTFESFLSKVACFSKPLSQKNF